MNIITYSLEKKIPIFIQFNLTRRCNLRCVHCCLGKSEIPEEGGKEDGTNRELNLTQIRAVLEQLARAGCLVLTFSGGEVLLREDLCDIINSARKQNFAVRIFTNGTLLGKKEIEAFRKFHIQEVHVSLYAADAAIHDAITGVPGSWAKSLEGIRQLREAGIRVKIKCAIMRQNVKEYHKVYTLAVSMGAGYAFDPIITARDNGDRATLKYRIDQDDLREVLRDPIFQGKGTIERGESPSCLVSGESDEVLCSAGHYICFISPEGDVTPCVQLPISCGNVRHSDFDWIWHHSPQMVRIRQLRTKDIQGCSDCPHLSGCARCPGLAYLEDGNLLGPSSAACWMVKAREMKG